ncbi:MAG: hypothetical protein QM662_17745 [Gordonia sp. (in: high G+C Gram-positive bacteria)]
MTDDDLRTLAAGHWRGHWPDSDVAALTALAADLRILRDRLDVVAEEIVAAHVRHLPGPGRMQQAVTTAGRALAGTADPPTGIAGAAATIGVLAGVVDRFAQVTMRAQESMMLAVAVADRDRLAGEVAALAGDDTVRAAAAGAVAPVLAAAADRYVDDAAQAGSTVDIPAPDIPAPDDPEPSDPAPSDQTPGDHLSGGAVPAAALPAGAGALGGWAAHRAGRPGPEGSAADVAASRGEIEWLLARTRWLVGSLSAPVASWVDVAVGLGADADGERTIVVATSDPCPYLRDGMRLNPGEVFLADGRAPEVAICAHLRGAGRHALAVASSRPPPPTARAVLATGAVMSVVAAVGAPGPAGS